MSSRRTAQEQAVIRKAKYLLLSGCLNFIVQLLIYAWGAMILEGIIANDFADIGTHGYGLWVAIIFVARIAIGGVFGVLRSGSK